MMGSTAGRLMRLPNRKLALLVLALAGATVLPTHVVHGRRLLKRATKGGGASWATSSLTEDAEDKCARYHAAPVASVPRDERYRDREWKARAQGRPSLLLFPPLRSHSPQFIYYTLVKLLPNKLPNSITRRWQLQTDEAWRLNAVRRSGRRPTTWWRRTTGMR
jgi:hypothetical protein